MSIGLEQGTLELVRNLVADHTEPPRKSEVDEPIAAAHDIEDTRLASYIHVRL